MGQYLKIGTSPADLIAHAQGLAVKGEALQGDLAGLLGDVASRETARVLPDDDFGKSFKDNTYHKPVPGGDGKTMPLNEATKDGINSVADVAVRYGTSVTQSMVGYISVEGQNQAGIGSSVE